MQVKSFLRNAVEFMQPAFGTRPETFYAVDVIRAISKLIVRVINPKMFAVADINQSVVAAPAVRMNDRFRRDVTAYNRLQGL